MKKLRECLFFLLVLLMISTPAFAAELPVIVSFSPTGTTTDNPQFRIVFSKPVVEEDAVGKIVSMADFPFEVSPAVIADGKWETPSVFTAALVAPLPKATAFTATAGGKIFRFQTEPLKLLSATQSYYSLNYDTANIQLKLEFNLPVSPSRLSGFLRLTAGDNVQLNFSSIGGLPSRSILIETRLTGNLVRENKLTLVIAKGLTANVGALGIDRDVRQTIDISPVFVITNSRVNEYDGAIIIESNNRIDIDRAQRFITIEPAASFRLESRWSGLAIIGDFKPRERVVVDIKKGVPAADGKSKLIEDYRKAFIIPDKRPSINFPASGMFLSPAVGATIPIETVNINELDITLWRLYESNLPYVLRNEQFRYDFPLDLSARVAKKVARISSVPNETQRRAIDIKSFLDNPSDSLQGLYMITANESDGDYWRQAEQIVSLTDIGLTARIWPGGCLVWANSIAQATPIDNVTIKMYDEASQLLAEGITDKEGLCRFFHDYSRSTPVLITAVKENDVSFVRLQNALLTNEAFDISGRAWVTDGYDGMIFTPRGVYRPGETVSAKAIVREVGSKIPSGFPILYIVRDPSRRTFTRGTAVLSAQGAADMEFELPDTALSGEYSIELYIPGKENSPFASYRFSVESFAPPRIEVNIERSDKAELSGFVFEGEDVTFDISSKYLFGVPAAGMPWRLIYQAVASDFVPNGEKWKAFKFRDPEKSSALRPSYYDIDTGTLDNEGKVQVKYKISESWNPPSIVNLAFVASVMEDSGRWISKEIAFKYFPNPDRYILGIEAPDECTVNETVRFRTAALYPDSEPVDLLEVKATLYRVVYHYNLVQRDGVTRWQTSQEHEMVEEKTITILDGVVNYDFTPRRYGEYLVRVEAPKDNSISTSTRFWCSDYDFGGGSRLVDKIELEPDKTSYKAGDTAKITVKAPFAGTLLFTVENSTLIGQQVIEMDGVQTDVLIPISRDIESANLWCVASVLRPVKDDEPWTAHRAIGVKSITIDKSEEKLPVSIEAPDKISPSSKLKVTVKSRADTEIALAFIDEGVLQITGYNTPDPYSYFYSKRGLSSNMYDIYDLLMQVESRATDLLHPSGGMAARAAAYMGNMNSKRFKILSIFKPSVIIGSSGEAEVELDIPEFSGKARLFAVGISGMTFGSASKFVEIARDVVVEANLPRFAAMGDVFSSPLSVFNTSERTLNVSVTLKTEGPLNISGDKDLTFNISPKSSESVEIAFNATGIGDAKYTVETKFGNDSEASVQEIDLPVRGLYPTVSETGMGRFGAGETVIKLPDNTVGPATRILTVTGTPVADLMPAVNYLLGYPYGCIEQTVSRAWAVLAVPEAVKMIDKELVDAAEISRKLYHAVASMQAMQLYNGSFATWPGNQYSNDWASVYAAHFLSDLKRAGVLLSFPDDMFNGVLNFLRQTIAEPINGEYLKEDLTTKAYACFVLALEKEAPLGLMYWLKENSRNLLPSGQIWLAGAYAVAEGNAEHLKALGGALDIGAPMASNPITLDSTVRNNAQMLRLWSLVQPEAPEAAILAENLIQYGRIGRWYGTQENSVSAVALSSYLKATGGQTETDLNCSISDPSGEVFAPARAFKAQDNMTFQVSEPGEWILKSEGSGNGYYSWVTTGEPKSAPRPESSGIKIETEWADSKGVKIAGDIKLGTEIFVTVRVIPTLPVMDVVVSVLLPAGLEIESNAKPGGYIADARDDRLLLFIERLNSSIEYKYVVRAVTKGNFALPPVSAEGMYSPAVRFIGSGGRINVVK